MSNLNGIDYGLPSVDDLFSTQEERDDAKLKKLHDIPVSLIDEFPEHPYQVRDDEDMMNLMESIKENGVLTPATVRKKEDGRYEMISGHRRKRACELAGIETLRCEIVDLDRDSAILMMVDSNLQRTTILPSEKAKAYKMRLDAMNRQGKRTDLTSCPEGRKLNSAGELAEEVKESERQVFRFIRLNDLVPGLLELVDENKIGLRPAVELSYLPEDRQTAIFEAIDMEQCMPSHAQTIKMRNMQKEGKLTDEVISCIMQEDKPNQKEKFVINDERAMNILKKYPIPNRAQIVGDALEAWDRQKAQEQHQEHHDWER